MKMISLFFLFSAPSGWLWAHFALKNGWRWPRHIISSVLGYLTAQAAAYAAGIISFDGALLGFAWLLGAWGSAFYWKALWRDEFEMKGMNDEK